MGAAAPMLLHGEVVQAGPQMQAPAYIADPGSRYDMSLLISKDKPEGQALQELT